MSTITASATTASAQICSCSAAEMPSTLPKMMWVRFVWLGVTEMSTRPSANRDVNTIPMDASSLTLLVPRSPPISTTASTPATSAPTVNGMPRM